VTAELGDALRVHSELRRILVVAVACVAAFVVFLDTTIVNVAFPAMERAFKTASRADVALTLTAYATVLGALLIPGGRIADYIGQRKVFLGALGSFAASSALCGLAPTLPVLIAGRVAQACSAALMAPSSLAVMFAEYPTSSRTYVVGLWSAAAGGATALGPAAGGAIVNSFGWRYVFLVNVPVAVAAVLLGYVSVLRIKESAAQRPDAWSIVLAVGAAVAFTTGLFGIAATATIAGRDLELFAVAIALTIACVTRGRWANNPLVDRSLLARPQVRAASVATFLTSSAGFALLFVNVIYLSSIWHYTPLAQGLAVTPGPIVTAAIVIPASKMASRYGAAAVAVPGVLLLAAGALWFHAHVGINRDWLGDWLPGAVLTGAGIGLSFPTIASAAFEAAEVRELNTAVALNGAIRQIGAVAGISAVVCLVGKPTGAQAATILGRGWLLVALLSLASVVALLPLIRSRSSVR
jgi:EmrB/QacA subfamily drug resistance transporter